jgi:hypothetical protein
MLEVFKTAEVRGDRHQLSELVTQITEKPAVGWHRNRNREPPKMPKLRAGHEVAVFRCEKEPEWPTADLFILGDGNSLKVTNIVPVSVPQLSRNQYNMILDDFVSQNIQSHAKDLKLTVNLTADRRPITDWMSSESAKLLATYSRSANRTITHPSDEDLWRNFLIQAHLDRTNLDTETLFRWLTEEEGWLEDRARELTIEFEFALSLLNDYDQRRENHDKPR